MAVAYSGGADSSALMRAAAQMWPGHLQAIHIHHGLQAAADGFAQECQQVCDALAVPLTVVRVNAQARPGQSPEDAARTARYQALARAAFEAQCQAVLLGQHADDQVETLLLALGRGAGLPGLAAMPERFERHGMVFMRPLLALGAQELRQWLLAGGHSFVDDPSNGDERFARNKLRARLLPALAEVMPHFRQTLARSARHAAQAQDLLSEVAAADLLQVGSPPVIQALQALSPRPPGQCAAPLAGRQPWRAAQRGAARSAASIKLPPAKPGATTLSCVWPMGRCNAVWSGCCVLSQPRPWCEWHRLGQLAMG